MIAALRKEGFTVHGVITPLDLVWSKLPNKEMKDLESYIYKNFQGKLNGPDFDLFLQQIPEKEPRFDFLRDILAHPSAGFEPGIAFEEAERAFPRVQKLGAEMPDNINPKGFVGKILGDREGGKYPHTKGLLLEKFMENKPDWVSSIVVVDDNQNVIDSVQKYNDEKSSPVPVSAIKVTSKDHEPKYYLDQLASHLVREKDNLKKPAKQKMTSEEIISDIQVQISNYNVAKDKLKLHLGGFGKQKLSLEDTKHYMQIMKNAEEHLKNLEISQKVDEKVQKSQDLC